MVLVLFLLALYYSWATWTEQPPTGSDGGKRFAVELAAALKPGTPILIAVRSTPEDTAFAESLRAALETRGFPIVGVLGGDPADARARLAEWGRRQIALEVVACNRATAGWTVWGQADGRASPLRVLQPRPRHWPNFLKTENLLNVANQIAVIALIAIGMTFVIIGGGIDLSVGSLIALSAVVATRLIRDWAGAEQASATGLVISCGLAVVLCGLVGAASGVLVTGLRIPPFIATLAMMLVASGVAFIVARGQSIYQVPATFVWLGRGMTAGVPNAVWLTAVCYGVAQLVMARSVLGRQVYAVGGNAEAARLSGVPVDWVRVVTYTLSGLLAGLGGVITASQLQSGAPTYGLMYELYVIAAVVVGGTSLAGGRGRVLGTLVGALIIGVIQNGMNLTGVESYTQKVVLGLVILGAVALDLVKQRAMGQG